MKVSEMIYHKQESHLALEYFDSYSLTGMKYIVRIQIQKDTIITLISQTIHDL